MRLQDRPSQVVQVLDEEIGVGGEITLETAKEGNTEKIGQRALGRRPLEHGQYRSVGDVRPIPAGFPLMELGIAGVELRALKNVPLVEVHAVDDADFIAVLQVLAHAGKIDLDFDSVTFQFCSRPNSGEHQELRCIESSSCEYDFS